MPASAGPERRLGKSGTPLAADMREGAKLDPSSASAVRWAVDIAVREFVEDFLFQSEILPGFVFTVRA